MQEGVWLLYISFQNHNTQAGTGNLSANLQYQMKNSFFSNGLNQEVTKVLSTTWTVIMLRHLLLLTEN